MREIRSWVVFACVLAACKGQSGTSAPAKQGSGMAEVGSDEPAQPVETPKQEGEIPVVLGDCAPTGTPFISGPEPQAFTAEELAKTKTGLFATMADGGDVVAAFVKPQGGLGLGTIGTIGHGSGTGVGYGLGGGGQGVGNGFGYGGGRIGGPPGGCGPGMDGMEVRTPGGGVGICGRYVARPTVTIANPTSVVTVAGVTYEKEIIRRFFKRNAQRLQYCYEKQLLAKPDIKGTVTATFIITPTGTVATANATGVDTEVSSCVAQVIMQIEFPKPSDGIVKVTYPLTFKPSDDDAPAKPVHKPPTDAMKVVKLIPTSKPYQSGATSELVALRIGLTDCFRRQDKHAAAVVFDLAPGKITATGLDNPAFTKCIDELGPQVKVKEPTRCSATFGVAGVDSLPAVDLTADSMSFLGTALVDPTKSSTPWWKLEALDKAATDHVKATLATKSALTIYGPLVVRPLPLTPMKTVTMTVHTLIAAGEDPVLAAQRNGTWQLLRNYPLPGVPVPLGTGGSWSSDAARRAEIPAKQLTLLVEAKDVLVMPGNKRVPLAKLADELKTQKASAQFADREDIWIAGADDVPYSQVVEVIDLADAAGFRRWSLTSPLAAK